MNQNWRENSQEHMFCMVQISDFNYRSTLQVIWKLASHQLLKANHLLSKENCISEF